jgi:hypothetical protein
MRRGGEVKRFLIEIDDEAWEDMCMVQQHEYERDKLSMPIPPPLDETVFYDYLCCRMGSDIEWPDEFAGVVITDVTNA